MFVVKKTLLILVSLLLVFSWEGLTHAKELQLDRSVDVSASVGEHYLNISGFISPFASVVLSSSGDFMRSTVADEKGNFSISQVRIKKGFSGFCLQAIDFKRIGESLSCLSFPPASASIEKRDLFLPPTIGLSRKKVNEGGSATVFGYTMPNASAQVHISSLGTLNVSADKTGYYETQIEKLKRGKYVLYATATLDQEDSLVPQSRVELEAISGAQQAINWLLEFIMWLWRIITSISIMFWIAIPVLILIIILLYKLWPEKFRFLIFWKRKNESDKQTRNTKHEIRNKLK